MPYYYSTFLCVCQPFFEKFFAFLEINSSTISDTAFPLQLCRFVTSIQYISVLAKLFSSLFLTKADICCILTLIALKGDIKYKWIFVYAMAPRVPEEWVCFISFFGHGFTIMWRTLFKWSWSRHFPVRNDLSFFLLHLVYKRKENSYEKV